MAAIVEETRQWLSQLCTIAEFSVEHCSFADLPAWSFVDGELRHESGRFFSIVGLQYRELDSNEGWRELAMINQPEIGILGFIARQHDDEIELLLQAKTEPGNVGGTQLAPTVQATESNYTAVHGGAYPHYLDYFLAPPRDSVIVDCLQSEQGSRFMGKRNRNMVVFLDEPVVPAEHPRFRWYSLTDIATLLRQDNLLNTDARSIIATLPQAFLSRDRRLSAKQNNGPADGFSARVHQSMNATEAQQFHRSSEIRNWLTALSGTKRFERRTVPLTELDSWQLENSALSPKGGGDFSVVPIQVVAHDREVPSWGQPIVSSTGLGRAVLVTAMIDGTLHALVQAICEAGTRTRFELTTSLQLAPGARPTEEGQAMLELLPNDCCRSAHLQSDEGGRFFKDVTSYECYEVPSWRPFASFAHHRWMTFRQLRSLLQEEHCLTNEARSLLANYNLCP